MNIVVQASPADLPEIEKILDSRILNVPRGVDILKVAKFMISNPNGSVYDGDIVTEFVNNTPSSDRAKFRDDLNLVMTLCAEQGVLCGVNSKSFFVNLSDVKECVECAKKMKFKSLYIFVNQEKLSTEMREAAKFLNTENFSQPQTPKKTEFSIPRFSTKSWKK